MGEEKAKPPPSPPPRNDNVIPIRPGLSPFHYEGDPDNQLAENDEEMEDQDLSPDEVERLTQKTRRQSPA
jgi:hypothetical protein